MSLTVSMIADLKKLKDNVTQTLKTLNPSLEVDEQGESYYTLPVNGSGYTTLSMGGVASADVIALVSERQCTVKLNGGSEEFYLDDTWVLFSRNITQVDVENQSATDTCDLYFFFAG